MFFFRIASVQKKVMTYIYIYIYIYILLFFLFIFVLPLLCHNMQKEALVMFFLSRLLSSLYCPFFSAPRHDLNPNSWICCENVEHLQMPLSRPLSTPRLRGHSKCHYSPSPIANRENHSTRLTLCIPHPHSPFLRSRAEARAGRCPQEILPFVLFADAAAQGAKILIGLLKRGMCGSTFEGGGTSHSRPSLEAVTVMRRARKPKALNPEQ